MMLLCAVYARRGPTPDSPVPVSSLERAFLLTWRGQATAISPVIAP
jgi:hypothetical protein